MVRHSHRRSPRRPRRQRRKLGLLAMLSAPKLVWDGARFVLKSFGPPQQAAQAESALVQQVEELVAETEAEGRARRRRHPQGRRPGGFPRRPRARRAPVPGRCGTRESDPRGPAERRDEGLPPPPCPRQAGPAHGISAANIGRHLSGEVPILGMPKVPTYREWQQAEYARLVAAGHSPNPADYQRVVRKATSRTRRTTSPRTPSGSGCGDPGHRPTRPDTVQARDEKGPPRDARAGLFRGLRAPCGGASHLSNWGRNFPCAHVCTHRHAHTCFRQLSGGEAGEDAGAVQGVPALGFPLPGRRPRDGRCRHRPRPGRAWRGRRRGGRMRLGRPQPAVHPTGIVAPCRPRPEPPHRRGCRPGSRSPRRSGRRRGRSGSCGCSSWPPVSPCCPIEIAALRPSERVPRTPPRIAVNQTLARDAKAIGAPPAKEAPVTPME